MGQPKQNINILVVALISIEMESQDYVFQSSVGGLSSLFVFW